MFHINHLQINNFRNYEQQKLSFHPFLNLISGENAQGKSNLLEAIYYLSVNRSFRTKRDKELANWKGSSFLLKGDFEKETINYHVKAVYDNFDSLKITINNRPVKRFDNLSLLPVVVFNPDDMHIVRDGPSVRRRFLNLILSRLRHHYLRDLKDYQRALMQRNRLLKEKYFHRNINELLEPWDEELIKIGSRMIHARVSLVEELERESQLFFLKVTDYREKLSLSYDSTVNYCSNISDTMRNFYSSLLAKRNQELKRKNTTIGPHIDDFFISINDHEARCFSSQGQKRTAALALKVAEANIIKKESNVYPLIILDDVFSEFDPRRKDYLLQFLKNNSGQCFISTAQKVDDIVDYLQSDYRLFKISQGKVVNEESKLGS